MEWGGGVVLFVVKKNKGRRRNEGGREEGYLSDHKLNIIDEFNQQI
jgi:hypothetical protein